MRVYITVSRIDYFKEIVTTEEEMNDVISLLKKNKIIRKDSDYYTYKVLNSESDKAE